MAPFGRTRAPTRIPAEVHALYQQRRQQLPPGSLELTLYDRIAQAGFDGIWIKDLREIRPGNETNKQLVVLTRRGFIAPFKNTDSSHRMYILAELAPGAQNGSVWSANGNFDEQLVRILVSQVLEACSGPAGATADEISNLIAVRGTARGELRETDLANLIGACVADGSLNRVDLLDGTITTTRYNCANPSTDVAGAFAAVPCTKCPLRGSCAAGNPSKPGGSTTPLTCEYWNHVLDF